MKISARPLKGEAFDIEVSKDDTVQALKVKIAATKPELPAELQKLVYAGKVLTDTSTLEECQMKENDFVVVMLSKPKSAVAAPSTTPAAAPAALPVVSPAAVPAASSTAGAGDATAPAAAAAAVAAALPPGSGSADATIQQLCDMGFSRPEVERCLRAAFGNPDRAVEYLMSGIPQGVLQGGSESGGGAGPGPQAAATVAPPAHAAPMSAVTPPPASGAVPATSGTGLFPGAPFPGVPAGGAAAAQASGHMAPLRNHPRFHQLRMVVQNMPQSLNQVLSAMAQSDPGLIQLIAENQEDFVAALQETGASGPAGQMQDPVSAMIAAAQAAQAAQSGASGGGAAAGPPPGWGLPPSATPSSGAAPIPQPAAVAPASAPQQPTSQPAVQLTAAEQEAIGRLQGLGFDRRAALEAYLACERNEEMAANYLFDAMEE